MSWNDCPACSKPLEAVLATNNSGVLIDNYLICRQYDWHYEIRFNSNKQIMFEVLRFDDPKKFKFRLTRHFNHSNPSPNWVISNGIQIVGYIPFIDASSLTEKRFKKILTLL